MSAEETRYGILDLVEATGIARRTIRYYVQRELLPPPRGAGRGHYYLRVHLDRLLQIRDLQDQGKSLEEIRAELLEGGKPRSNPRSKQRNRPLSIERVTRITVTTGIEILVTAGAVPPTPSQMQALAIAAREILGSRERED